MSATQACREAPRRNETPTPSSCARLHGLAGLDDVADARLEQHVLVDLAVGVACLDQLLVRAAGGDAAVLEHDELVGERERREPVRDDDRLAAAHRLAQAEAYPRLGRRVDGGGRVV